MKNVIVLLAFLIIYNCAISQVKTIGTSSPSTTSAKISGKVKDGNGEAVVGAVVQIASLKKAISADFEGNFSLTIPVGNYEMIVSMIGFKSEKIKINLLGNGAIDVVLKEDQHQLDEVIISSARPEQNVKSTDMGKSVLTIEALKSMPAFAGEVDVIRSITLLPGVSTTGEASSGFNVRGGSSSQNLILLGGATLYNPSHLFGFFTAFNADLVQNVTLYKGGIPARYGGRASSILDIEYKSEAAKKWQGKASIGLISAKVTLEGPIIKEKLSVMLGGRSSYSDWMLGATKDPDIRNSSASFYDLNAIVNFRPNNNNKIVYSFYTSGDKFGFASDTSISWSNLNHVVDWQHSFNDRFSFSIAVANDNYNYAISNENRFNKFKISSGITSNSIRINSDLKLFNESTINFGFETSHKTINPGNLEPEEEGSFVNDITIEKESALESGAFAELNLELHEKLSLTMGIRYNTYTYLGTKRVYTYEELLPRTNETIIDSTFYGKFAPIAVRGGIEPRVSFRLSLSETSSLKAGYNRMYQYLHLISNTSTIAPTDIWKLSDQFLSPAIVDQYSAGIFKNFSDNSYETSVEVYYKTINNIVEYKDGAELLLNQHIETELLSGIGKAYGIELFIKKKVGHMTGWLGYTYSRSLSKVEGAYKETSINKGEWFASNYDKPHDFTAVFMYAFNPQWSISSNFTFSTGRPFTNALAKFEYEGEGYAYFNDRNGSRVPSYHRLDFSATYKSISKYKLLNGDWAFSVYNLYGRKNAFSVFFDDVDGAPPQAYKLSILGIPFPSLSYSFKF